jgi:hypothetical protein
MTQLQMAARMQDARDAMRTLFGEEYPAKVQPWKEKLQAAMPANKNNVINAVLTLAKENEPNGVQLAMMLAAAVEIIEGEKK